MALIRIDDSVFVWEWLFEEGRLRRVDTDLEGIDEVARGAETVDGAGTDKVTHADIYLACAGIALHHIDVIGEKLLRSIDEGDCRGELIHGDIIGEECVDGAVCRPVGRGVQQ